MGSELPRGAARLRRFSAALRLFLLFGALLLPAPLQAQRLTDLIRGRVVTTDSVPLAGARVTVVSIVSQMSRSATTDSSGRYTVVFPGGDGNYIASFNMVGFFPVVRQVKRLNDEDLLVANIAMRAAEFVLPSVVVSVRSVPQRGSGSLPDSTGTWDVITGLGLSLGDMGNLARMAAQIPGVELVTDADGNPIGISVLGLGADQNLVTVDGVQQNINDLPTDGMPEARLTTTTSDPSRGGFSGGAVSVASRSGSWQVGRSMTLTLDEPNLQFSDRVGQQLGREYTNVQIGASNTGPIVEDRLFFRGSAQVGRRTSDRYTILNTGALALQQVGASADSVRRLQSVMEELGIPADAARIPGAVRSDNASIMLRTDFTPEGKHSLNTTVNASWRNETAFGSSPLTVPTRGGETETLTGSVQLNHSFYFPFNILSETKLALSTNTSNSSAFLDLPDAKVRIRSDKAEGGTSVATFQLGGNSSMPVSSRNTKWEFINSLSWASKDNAHRIKLGVELRLDDYSKDQATNRLGTFTFSSLEDFRLGLPSDFRRQLTTVRNVADLATVALSLGDQWRKTKDLNFQYGVRVEVDRYGSRPRYNEVVTREFGVRNDHAPNDVHVIPRFGFTWSYGVAPQIAAFEGATRGPRATLRGTIGEYRNTPGRSLLQSAMGSTGLPDGIQQLSCSGEAAPIPEWGSYATSRSNIPEVCADGTGSSVFSSRQPSVLLFGESYQPERSWRADLGWSGTALRRYKLSATGIYSFNFAQTGDVDLNFRNSIRFRLPLEQNRPVYVAPTSISTRSGSVATADGRVSTDFSKVTERRSDLRSMSTQFNVTLSPVVVSPRGVRWSMNYVFSRISEFDRGFGGTTSGSPLPRSWQVARDPHHQINASLNYEILGIKLGVAARVTSGIHYTPMVRGDVNGDGEGNDRAFVFDPALSADSAVVAGMSELLATAPSGARSCLLRQVGRIASPNSCTGPWSSIMNFTMSLDARQFVLPGRTTVAMSFGNPMTGIDLLLNRTPEPRSWGRQYNNPDATLLHVRGFDPATRQFRYEVNPDFGSSRAARATQGKPFVITLKVSSDLSPPIEKQTLRREIESWQSGRVRRPSEASLKRQYMQQFTNMFESILRQADTLGLSAAQRDSIAGTTDAYVARIDSLWSPIASYMAELPPGYRLEEAYSRMTQVRRTSWMWMSQQAQLVRGVLTEEQFLKLPASYSKYFDEKYMRQQR